MRAYQRLMHYAKFPTASAAASPTCPSTEHQLAFAKELQKELIELGLSDVTLDENGYLFATLPANIPDHPGPVIGFLAHMDVSEDAPAESVRPQLIEKYDGGDILLNAAENIVMTVEENPILQQYIGDDLVVTDGLTLLGADDKAGIAEIVTMAETLLQDDSIKHGKIMLGFTPDEEIGRGPDHFDVARFGADFAYTLDGADVEEVGSETFSAMSMNVTVTGVGIHPGEAKNKMINAQRVALEFDALLPEGDRPEHTEGREGFFHLHWMNGEVERAFMHYILRDYDFSLLERRAALARDAADYLNRKYGADTVKLEIEESYRNMYEVLLQHPHLLEIANDAIRAEGLTPRHGALRGGTDGSRLSYMGLPCPNLGTGSHNHHGRMEFASAQAMDCVVRILLRIAERYSQGIVE